MARLPSVKILEIVHIGFLGEYDPDNKRTPDPNEATLPKGLLHASYGQDQHAFIRVVKGSLQDALQTLVPEQSPATAAARGTATAASEAAAEPTPDGSAEGTTPVADAPAPGPLAAPLADGAPLAPLEALTAEPPTLADAAKVVEEGGVRVEPRASVPPTMCIIAHPHLHRYFTDFHPAVKWLIESEVPTAVIGSSEPDHSWKQDEILLSKLGASLVVGKRLSPFPMCLPDDPKIKKCNHVIGFCGGKALERDKLTKVKLDLLAQDYTVR